jgi:predicted RNA binding protein YcfA (HicA-like mRNA interferase family)
VSGADLTRALARLGYRVTRQTGSHLRLTATLGGQEHHLTVPNHDPIKVGTLNSILKDVAAHANLSRDELLDRVFS